MLSVDITDGQPVDGHADLHSEHGANRGEHTGRCLNPIVKVTDLAWLEFVKPDLKRALGLPGDRWRHVRQHPPTRLGAADRVQPRPVGAKGAAEFLGVNDYTLSKLAAMAKGARA
jgi:hypothetical protein